MLKRLFTSTAVDVVEAHRLMDQDEAVLVDVRTKEEWKQGHVEGAVHISLPSLENQLRRIPTDKPVLVICRSGSRSARAVSLLRRAGFDARNVKGGILAWARAGFPLTRR